MIYIPDEWFNDLQNKNVVFELFENHTDIIPDDSEQVIRKTLTDLNEMVILEHYEDDDIVI